MMLWVFKSRKEWYRLFVVQRIKALEFEADNVRLETENNELRRQLAELEAGQQQTQKETPIGETLPIKNKENSSGICVICGTDYNNSVSCVCRLEMTVEEIEDRWRTVQNMALFLSNTPRSK